MPTAISANTLLESLQTDFPPPVVISLGRSIFDPIWRENEHASKQSEMTHIITGKVDQVMRCTTVHGERGDTIYTPNAMLHRDVFTYDTPFEVYLVHFNWEGEKKLLDYFPADKLAGASASIKQQLDTDFANLYRDFQTQGLLAKQMVNLRLLRIILSMAKAVIKADQKFSINTQAANAPDTTGRSHQIMEQARQVISLRYNQPLSLETIAKAVHVSPYHLSHAFSEESEFTLSSHITNVRMEKASELLSEGKLNVSEVAYAVGYTDPAYFSKVFKAHYGQAPSTFRNR